MSIQQLLDERGVQSTFRSSDEFIRSSDSIGTRWKVAHGENGPYREHLEVQDLTDDEIADRFAARYYTARVRAADRRRAKAAGIAHVFIDSGDPSEFPLWWTYDGTSKFVMTAAGWTARQVADWLYGETKRVIEDVEPWYGSRTNWATVAAWGD